MTLRGAPRAATLGALSPPTRGDWAAERLRGAIIAGELAPGSRLRTAELAAQLAVSPTPLREALQRLAAEGLVELSPQRGARVAPLDVAGGLDVYRIRLMLEPPALADAVNAGPPLEWDQRVAAALHELNRLTVATPFVPIAFNAVHTGFHQLLLEPCRSPWLLRISRQLADHSTRFQLLSVGLRGGHEHVVSEHTHLAALVAERAANKAQEALRRHIQETVDHVLAKPAREASATEGT